MIWAIAYTLGGIETVLFLWVLLAGVCMSAALLAQDHTDVPACVEAYW